MNGVRKMNNKEMQVSDETSRVLNEYLYLRFPAILRAKKPFAEELVDEVLK